jgi:hypothetical protein
MLGNPHVSVRWGQVGVLEFQDLASYPTQRPIWQRISEVATTGMRDQLNHRFQRDERSGPPVNGNERKEAMLDLVPCAGGRWRMRHGDRELCFIGQRMPRLLPQLVADAIAASPISSDQQVGCLRIELFAAALPPPPDTFHCELCRLMIDAHGDLALVVKQVIDAVRDGFAVC